MRYIQRIFPAIALMVVMVAVTGQVAWAHGHSRFSIGGFGYYGPGSYGSYGYGGYGIGRYGFGGYGYPYYYYHSPLYSYPQTIIVPTTPPVYIQRQDAQLAQPQANYWYYCRDADGYYPYVRDCPGGWMQVAPQPSGQ